MNGKRELKKHETQAHLGVMETITVFLLLAQVGP